MSAWRSFASSRQTVPRGRNPKLQTLYGLRSHPFRPDVPLEALHATPAVDALIRRVEVGIADGGFVMITGDPGTGKSVALRLLADRLPRLPDVLVGAIEHPQSRTSDFIANSAILPDDHRAEDHPGRACRRQ